MYEHRFKIGGEHMRWLYNDGGRSKYFKGATNDCVCRAISIAENKNYKEVYDLINKYAKEYRKTNPDDNSHARYGVSKELTKKILTDLGWIWKSTMKFGLGTSVHMRENELPKKGTLIVSLSKHFTVVKDGVIYDIFDPSRNGKRCVYGYYIKA